MQDNFRSQHPQRHRRPWPVPGHWRGAHLLLALLLVFAGAFFASGSPVAAVANQPVAVEQDEPLTGIAALEQLKAHGAYTSLVEAYTQARYAFHAQGDGQRVVAANPAHDLTVALSSEGVSLSVGGPALNPTQANARYKTHWQLTGLGYGATATALAPPVLQTIGARVALVRPQVTEWYVNRSDGLEQGFTLPARPGANPHGAPLQLTLAVSGDLIPQRTAQEQGLTLYNARGQAVLTYHHLQVWDADGIPLPARLTTSGQHVYLLVEDAHARYPLTIDPTFTQQAYLKASNTELGDQFGRAVAVSGDTAVVGAAGEDSNATGVNGDSSNNSAGSAGAAYVFVRSGTSWSQQAYLKASNTNAGDAFGIAVAVFGDTVVVAATSEDSNATGVNGDGSNNGAGGAGAAYVFSVLSLPEIDVQGNSVSIANGDSTPAAADHTDFGRIDANGGSVVRTFTIGNSGTGALTLSGSPLVSVTGNSAFTVSSQPASSSVAAGGSTTFQVTFAPSAAGVVTATVRIANDDSDENPYTFVVQGIRTGSNVALGQPASQSSTYPSPCDPSAAKAVDGNTDGNWSSCSVAHTNNDNQAWWQVDLQASYLIDVVDIWNRTDCCGGGLSNFDLHLSTDGTTWTSFYYPDTVTTSVSFVVNQVARYVKVQLRGSNFLTLAEVQVWGPALPEIDLQGNGVSIANGDGTPSSADHTDFGSVTVSGATLVRTFTIRNIGTGALTLSGSPLVELLGANASAFSVTTQPASSVAANDSTTFQVTFDPSAASVVTATVSLANNDSDEHPYTFVVGGTGSVPNAQLNGVACDLIDAIIAANSDAATGGCPAGSGADTITLLSDVELTAVNNADGNGSNGLPQISSNITIEGGGYTLSRGASAPAFRFFFVPSGGTLTLNRLTLHNGNAIDTSDDVGGAIYNNSGTVTVNNSTFSGNTATVIGGGIRNALGTLTVNNSTFSGNTATGNGGGIYNVTRLTLTRSLLSGNSASNGAELYNEPDNPLFGIPAGTVNSSNNLFGYSNNAGTANFTPTGSDLVPSVALAAILDTTLADNGGGTQTHALVAGSPALDAAGDSGLATDQRGITRPQGAADDIGAFELEGVGCAAPEIDVQGNGVSIANGDTTPSSADHTDFGTVAVNSGTVVRTFTINNTGTGALALNGSPLVSVTGDSAFTVSTQPASSSVAASGSTTFQLTFAPTISGTITATVRIANNDSNETPYTFVVQGAAAGQIDRGDQVTQADYTAVYQPTPQSCANLPPPGLPIHTLTPTLRNNTSNSYQGLYFVVTELGYTAAQGGNVPTLCNADGGNGGGVGARVTATDAVLSDGFNPNESFAQAFQVGLPVRARYRLFVNLYARPATVAAADQAADSAADLIGVLSWEFDENGNLITSRQVFLPLVAK